MGCKPTADPSRKHEPICCCIAVWPKAVRVAFRKLKTDLYRYSMENVFQRTVLNTLIYSILKQNNDHFEKLICQGFRQGGRKVDGQEKPVVGNCTEGAV